jgi:hypothetical protein
MLYLANAPGSVLNRLRDAHPGVYVIHKDAPRSFKEMEEIIERIDVAALRDGRMSIHQIGRPSTGMSG